MFGFTTVVTVEQLTQKEVILFFEKCLKLTYSYNMENLYAFLCSFEGSIVQGRQAFSRYLSPSVILTVILVYDSSLTSISKIFIAFVNFPYEMALKQFIQESLWEDTKAEKLLMRVS